MVSESSEKKILRERTNQSQITDIFFNFKSDLEKHTFHCHALQCLSVPSFYFHSLFLSIFYMFFSFIFICSYLFIDSSLSLYISCLISLTLSLSFSFFLSASPQILQKIFTFTRTLMHHAHQVFLCVLDERKNRKLYFKKTDTKMEKMCHK
jgi:hypothetical protein